MPVRTLVLLGIVSLAGCQAAAPPPAAKPAAPAAAAGGVDARTQLAIRDALLASLETVTLTNCTYTRVGSRNDGGYVMCGNLMGKATAGYSYGIGGNDDWGCSISKSLKAPVHQYDCFEPPTMSCTGGKFVPHNECVGTKAETIDGRAFDSIPSQIARNGDAGKNLIVKIDVEGAEWKALLETPDAVLDKFDQLAMELHGTSEAHYIDVVQKLKRTFHLVHVHYNNWACTPTLPPFAAAAYQVLFVNKRLGVVGPHPAGQPTPRDFDAPDNPKGPDCQPTRSTS